MYKKMRANCFDDDRDVSQSVGYWPGMQDPVPLLLVGVVLPQPHPNIPEVEARGSGGQEHPHLYNLVRPAWVPRDPISNKTH